MSATPRARHIIKYNIYDCIYMEGIVYGGEWRRDVRILFKDSSADLDLEMYNGRPSVEYNAVLNTNNVDLAACSAFDAWCPRQDPFECGWVFFAE